MDVVEEARRCRCSSRLSQLPRSRSVVDEPLGDRDAKMQKLVSCWMSPRSCLGEEEAVVVVVIELERWDVADAIG